MATLEAGAGRWKGFITRALWTVLKVKSGRVALRQEGELVEGLQEWVTERSKGMLMLQSGPKRKGTTWKEHLQCGGSSVASYV